VLYQGVWSRYFSTDETCSALEKPRMRSSVHFHLKVPVAVLFLTHMQHFQNTNGTRMIERDLTESEGHDYSFSLYWCGFGWGTSAASPRKLRPDFVAVSRSTEAVTCGLKRDHTLWALVRKEKGEKSDACLLRSVVYCWHCTLVENFLTRSCTHTHQLVVEKEMRSHQLLRTCHFSRWRDRSIDNSVITLRWFTWSFSTRETTTPFYDLFYFILDLFCAWI